MKPPHRPTLLVLLGSALIAFASAASAADSSSKAAELPVYFTGGELRIVSSSHQDTAWMDTPDFCRRFRIEKNILPALERMRVDPDYTFCMEGTLHLMEFLDEHPELYNEVLQRTREGRFEWGATYNQPYESWFSGEELVRELYFGRRWIRKHLPGCDAKVAFNPDPPARALQMQQILAKAGVPYLFISRFHEGLHRWQSPDGSSVLAYSPGQYTNHSRFLERDPVSCGEAIRAKLVEQAPYYAQRRIPPVFPLINSRDFSEPVDFKPLMGFWNGQPATAGGARPPTMRYSSIRGFFEAIDTPAAKFDTLLGERPDVWAYITDPTHRRMASVRREGARLLPAAEMFTTFASLLGGSFGDWPRSRLAAAWLDQLYIDHGIGGKNGHITDEVFLRRVEHARDIGRELLDRALGTIAGQVKTDAARGTPLVVFNDRSWARSDVVTVDLPASVSLSVRVLDAEGREVPSQLTSRSGADEVNVATTAMGAQATASSVWSADFAAAKAIDGRWAVHDPHPELGAADEWKSEPGPGPHALTLDLGQSRRVHKVVLRHEGVLGVFGAETKHNTADFALQAADSPEGPWVDLMPPVKGNTLSLTTHTFAPRAVRFLRLHITKGSQDGGDGAARILEVQAFARMPIEARTLMFVAREVPSLGYKTFYLSRDGSAASSSVATRSVAATESGCENEFYRVALAPGGIKSIFDKARRRELLATDSFLGGEVFTMLSVAPDNRRFGTDAGEFGTMPLPVMDESFDRVAVHKPRWTLRENGPMRAVYQLEQPLADVTVRQRVVVWHEHGRIDCEVDLLEFTGRFWREFRMALPLAARNPRLTYEVPIGVVEIGKDEIPTTGGFAKHRPNAPDLIYPELCRDIHPRQAQNFIDASDETGGLTMSTSVSVFDWIDPTGRAEGRPVLQPVLLASRKSCNGRGVWYPQTGDHSYRFSLTSHGGGWRQGWRDGIAANHPLIPVFAQTTAEAALPAAMSFCRTTADNLVISTIKKCEDDDAIIVRLYDIEGRSAPARIELFRPAAKAELTNIIEEGGRPLEVRDGNAVVEVGHHAIETVKLTVPIR